MANRKKTKKSARRAESPGFGDGQLPKKDRRRFQQEGDGGDYAPPKRSKKTDCASDGLRGVRTRTAAGDDDDNNDDQDDELVETDDTPAASTARPRLVVKLSRATPTSHSPTPPVAGPSMAVLDDESDAGVDADADDDDDEEAMEREEERHIIAEVGHAHIRSRRSSARHSLASQTVSEDDEVDHVLLELAHLPLRPTGEAASSESEPEEFEPFDFDRLLALATTGGGSAEQATPNADPMTSWFVEKDSSLTDTNASSSSGDDEEDDESDELDPNAPMDSDEEADGILLCQSDSDDGGGTTDSLDDGDESALIRFGIEADVDPAELAEVEVTVSVATLADDPALAIAQTAKQLGVDEQTAVRILSDVGYSFKATSPALGNDSASGSGTASIGPRTPPDEANAGPSKVAPEPPPMGFFAVPAARPVGTTRAVVLDGSTRVAPSPFSVPRTLKRRRQSDVNGDASRARRDSVASSQSSRSGTVRSQSQSTQRRGLSPTTELDFDGEDEGDASSTQIDLLDVLHASVLTGSPMLMASGSSSSPVTRRAPSLAFSPAHQLPNGGPSTSYTRSTVFLPRTGHLLYSPALVPVPSPPKLKKRKSGQNPKSKGKARSQSIVNGSAGSVPTKERRRSRSSQVAPTSVRRSRASSSASSLELEPPSAGCGGLPILASPAITGAASEGMHIPAISLDGTAFDGI